MQFKCGIGSKSYEINHVWIQANDDDDDDYDDAYSHLNARKVHQISFQFNIQNGLRANTYNYGLIWILSYIGMYMLCYAMGTVAGTVWLFSYIVFSHGIRTQQQQQ